MRTTASTTLDYIPEPIRAFVARRSRGPRLDRRGGRNHLGSASWSVDDPSFNHAASGPVHNLLGAPGAIAVDLIMQLLGLCSIVFLAPPILWGWRLPTHRCLERLTARLMLWLGCSLCSAGLAAMLPSI
jgi:DNA segregation ATPase FtsK/SpoIIIE, S-DNA-T family